MRDALRVIDLYPNKLRRTESAWMRVLESGDGGRWHGDPVVDWKAVHQARVIEMLVMVDPDLREHTKYSTLATISNTEEVSVHISIPFARYLEVRGGEEDSTPSYDNRALLSDISLVLSDGSDYPYKGSYAYTERNAGDQTGTIIIVASFPNPRRVLKVGQTATVVANVGSPKGVVLVPQKAVVQMLNTAGVWVVGKDNAVSYKLVTLGSTFGDMWIVESGLTGGEVVVVGGGQKLRSGQKVKTQFHS